MNSKKKLLIDYTTIETNASTKSMRTDTTSNRDFLFKEKSSKNYGIKLEPIKLKKFNANLISRNKRKMFDKIYGISNLNRSSISKIKKETNLSLQEYHNKLLQLSVNVDKANLIKLNKTLRNIRVESSQVQPLPPLNYKALVEHSKNEIKKELTKYRISLKMSLLMNAIKDEYEIDLEKERRTYVRPMKETANIKRMYEILPEYIVNVFFKEESLIW